MIISTATQRNWNKLNANAAEKLKSRANKTESLKRFVPAERCEDDQVKLWIENFVDAILANKWNIESVLYSLAVNILIAGDLQQNPACKKFIAEYGYIPQVEEILPKPVPQGFDVLGTVYQAYLTEGEKNKRGSYFTNRSIVSSMLASFDLAPGKKFLDPCCGSGAFLISLNNVSPDCIYGFDVDEIAVMLAKANLILKYSELNPEFYPKIYNLDFLTEDSFLRDLICRIGKFDFIATNPPWGAVSDKISCAECEVKDSSTRFFVKSLSILADDGRMNFLMPVSVLNVRAHKAFREYILAHGGLRGITIFDELFTGVTTQYASLLIENGASARKVLFTAKGKTAILTDTDFIKTDGKIFNFIDDIDRNIISKIKSKGELTLKSSKWALGIVTGNNKEKLRDVRSDGMEVIYTGREIQPFKLKPAKKYIRYDRRQLQQVARDEYYRAPEKLVYKFISKKLVFAYDDSRALFLNSANILIPNIEGMSIKTAMAFLNADIFQYLYIKLFNEVKILKGNLLELPFPHLTKEQDKMVEGYVNRILNGDQKASGELSFWMRNFYSFDDNEAEHIQEVVNGNIN